MGSLLKNREECFDIMKGIGIIAVVACHCCFPFEPFMAFHLPIFMFVSGYFHPIERSQSWREYGAICWKRFRQLSIPLMLICTVITLFQPVLVWLHWLDAPADTPMQLMKNVGTVVFSLGMKKIPLLVMPLWFTVLALFNCLGFEFLRTILGKFTKCSAVCMGVLAILIYFFGVILIVDFQKYGAKINFIGSSCMLFPHFVIGHALRVMLLRHSRKLTDIATTRKAFIALVLTLPVLVQISRHGIMWKSAEYHVFTLLFTMLGIVLTISCSCLLEHIPGYSVFSYLGRNSYMIMTWHLCSFKILASFLLLVGFWDIVKVKAYPTPRMSGWLPVVFCLVGLAMPLALTEGKRWTMKKFSEYCHLKDMQE